MKRSKFRKYALLVTIHLESSHAAILYVPYKDSRCLNKVKCGLRVQSGESASVVKLLFESSGTSSVLNTSHVMKGQYLISSSFQTLTFSSQPRAKWFREYFLQNKQSNAVIYNSNCMFQNDRTRKHMNRNNEIIVYNYYNEYVIVLKCTSHKFRIQNYKHSESFRIEDSFSDNR